MIPFVWRFENAKDTSVEVVIESNGRVCYAYFIDNGALAGDVWLWNVAVASDTPEWTLPDARERLPFLNPPTLGRQDVVAPTQQDEVLVRFGVTKDGRKGARIDVMGVPWALIRTGDKPGRCIHAIQDGPVAKRMEE